MAYGKLSYGVPQGPKDGRGDVPVQNEPANKMARSVGTVGPTSPKEAYNKNKMGGGTHPASMATQQPGGRQRASERPLKYS